MAKAKVTFLPLNKTVEIDTNTPVTGHDGEPGSILAIALLNGVKIEHVCGGNAACTTCHVIVKQGMDNLTEMEDREADLLDKAPGVTLKSRLSCQSVVKGGEIIVEIPPHTINQVSGSH